MLDPTGKSVHVFEPNVSSVQFSPKRSPRHETVAKPVMLMLADLIAPADA